MSTREKAKSCKERYVFQLDPEVGRALRSVVNRTKDERRNVTLSEVANVAIRKHLKKEIDAISQAGA